MNTTPSLPRRLGRGVYRFLSLLALASAIAGGPFAYLAWVEATSSGEGQTEMVREIKELRKIAALSLEQEEQRLVLDRAMLASLERLLPEAEGTRLEIAKLAKLFDLRLAGVREQRRKLDAEAQLRQAPPATSWWDRNRPDSPPSIKARELLGQMDQP